LHIEGELRFYDRKSIGLLKERVIAFKGKVPEIVQCKGCKRVYEQNFTLGEEIGIYNPRKETQSEEEFIEERKKAIKKKGDKFGYYNIGIPVNF